MSDEKLNKIITMIVESNYDVIVIRNIINELNKSEKEDLFYYYSQKNIELDEKIQKYKEEITQMRENLYNGLKK